jgi:hypothetical protein
MKGVLAIRDFPEVFVFQVSLRAVLAILTACQSEAPWQRFGMKQLLVAVHASLSSWAPCPTGVARWDCALGCDDGGVRMRVKGGDPAFCRGCIKCLRAVPRDCGRREKGGRAEWCSSERTWMQIFFVKLLTNASQPKAVAVVSMAHLMQRRCNSITIKWRHEKLQTEQAILHT